MNSNNSSWATVSFSTTEWYQSLQKADNGYPFPAVVTKEDGTYTHYGDWPAGKTNPLTNATLLSGASFEVGYDHDFLHTPDTDVCNLYQLEDGTYYAEFSFTQNQMEDDLVRDRELYMKCPVPGLTDDRGRQIYLTFGDGGVCGVTTSSGVQNVTDGLIPDTVYSLYIYGVDLSKDSGSQTITWRIEKK